MTKKIKPRYVRITAPMVEQVGHGVLSYQEFCVLCYMLTFCGITNGHRNPYKRGRKGIRETLQISDSRAKRILYSLQDKGFVIPIYCLVRKEQSNIMTHSLKRARAHALSGGQVLTYYHTSKFPNIV